MYKMLAMMDLGGRGMRILELDKWGTDQKRLGTTDVDSMHNAHVSLPGISEKDAGNF